MEKASFFTERDINPACRFLIRQAGTEKAVPLSAGKRQETQKKAAASYLPLRVFSPPRRLTSEFGMGSGVSAWLSPPPRIPGHVLWKPNAIVLSLIEKKLRSEPSGGPPSSPQGKLMAESSGYWGDLALHVAVPAPIVHQTGDLPVPLPPSGMGGLLSGTASRLDALSVYPDHGRLPGDASGETTRPP